LGMKVLKLFLIFTLCLSPIQARNSDSLVLRANVPAVLGLPTGFKNSLNSLELKEALVFNGDKRKFKIRKIENKKQVYLEVTFH